MVDRVALIKGALSLRMSMRFLSFFRVSMAGQRKKLRRRWKGKRNSERYGFDKLLETLILFMRERIN